MVNLESKQDNGKEGDKLPSNAVEDLSHRSVKQESCALLWSQSDTTFKPK